MFTHVHNVLYLYVFVVALVCQTVLNLTCSRSCRSSRSSGPSCEPDQPDQRALPSRFPSMATVTSSDEQPGGNCQGGSLSRNRTEKVAHQFLT